MYPFYVVLAVGEKTSHYSPYILYAALKFAGELDFAACLQKHVSVIYNRHKNLPMVTSHFKDQSCNNLYFLYICSMDLADIHVQQILKTNRRRPHKICT